MMLETTSSSSLFISVDLTTMMNLAFKKTNEL